MKKKTETLQQKLEELYATRRRNLNLLIGVYRTIRNINQLVGRELTDTTWSQLRSGRPDKDGYVRPFSDKMARELEEKLLLDQGWMDLPHQSAEGVGRIDFLHVSSQNQSGKESREEAPPNVAESPNLFLQDTVALHPEKEPWLRVFHSDQSTSSVLPPGSCMVVDTQCRKFVGDGVYLLNIAGHSSFRKIAVNLDGTLRVKADLDGNVETVDPASIRIIGKAVKLWEGSFL